MDGLGKLSLSDRKIIVGVDFGTTYSGLAWAETRRVRMDYYNNVLTLALVDTY